EDELRIASLQTLASVPAGVTGARSQELRQLGVPQGNVLELKDCPGALVPEPERRICPRSPTLVALVSLPDSSSVRSFVQVLLIAADSRSKTALVTGFFMESSGGRWRLVEQRIPV